MIIRLCSLATILMIGLNSFAQTPTALPKITHPSPQVQNFMKFGDYPVSYNTGIPDISIPLYTVRSGDIEVPITLRYHSSGVKPRDEDVSNIGVGWVLEVGGMISREIRGECDELIKKPATITNAANINLTYQGWDYGYLSQLAGSNGPDEEYDHFSYSIPGQTGKFLIDDPNRNGVFTSYIYPFKPYKIDVQTGPPPASNLNFFRSIAGIDLTDDEGTKFKFGHSNAEYNATIYGPTAWFLEEIESSDKTNQVTFLYDAVPQFTAFRGNSNQVTVNEDNGKSITYECSQTQSFPEGNCSQIPSLTGSGYITKALTRINFKDGYIQFNLDNDKRRIISIAIYNTNNEIIRSIEFNRVLTNSQLQYKLTSVIIKNSAATQVEKYDFSYYTDLVLTSQTQPSMDSWEYCNGIIPTETWPSYCAQRTVEVFNTLDHPTSTPGTPLQIGSVSFAPDATTNADYMKHNILTQIKYPTGGTTTFDYEPNTYKDPNDPTQSVIRGGGLRIKQITSSPIIGDATVKTYEYEPGFIEHSLLDPANYTNGTGYLRAVCMDINNYESIFYLFKSTSFANGWNSHLGSNNVYYKNITEYTGNQTNNLGKNTYHFKYENPNEKSTANHSYGTPSFFINHYRNWGNGLLFKQETFKTGIGGYEKVKSVVYDYEKVNLKTVDNFYAATSIDVEALNGAIHQTEMWKLPPFFKYANYKITTGEFHQKQIREVGYFGGDSLITLTDYEYNNPNHYYPTKVIKSLSTGEKQVSTFSYVDESSTAVPYTAMKSANIIKPLLEKNEYIRNTSNVDRLVRTEKTIYNNWSTHVFQPISVLASVNGDTPNSIIEFHGYNSNGEVTSVSKANGPKTCYLYSYKGQYPIAKIENVEYSTIESLLGAPEIENLKNSSPSTETQIINFLQPLRNNLSNTAEITTYTYDPLIGMTSMIDPRGQRTTYEYDIFQRLARVKDHNGNIVKEYCYNYAGQQSNCSSVTVPVVVNTGEGGTQTVFARMEMANMTSYSQSNNGLLHLTQNHDVYIRFYSNVYCTQPYTLTTPMNVNYLISYWYTYTGGVDSGQSPNIHYLPAGSNSYWYDGVETYYYDEYAVDPVWGILYDLIENNYSLTPGTGYTPKLTIWH